MSLQLLPRMQYNIIKNRTTERVENYQNDKNGYWIENVFAHNFKFRFDIN